MKRHYLFLPAALAVAACHHAAPPVALAPQPAPVDTTRRAPTPPPARDTMAAANAAQARADSVRAQIMRDSAAAADRTASGLPPAEDSVLTARIHFGFDTSTLNDEAKATLQEKVRLLRQHDRLKIEIAGNADERGSDEYNLALGLRRAAAAKAFLTAYGIGQDRITIISYGEERPLDAASTDAAMAKNRRDDFAPSRGSAPQRP